MATNQPPAYGQQQVVYAPTNGYPPQQQQYYPPQQQQVVYAQTNGYPQQQPVQQVVIQQAYPAADGQITNQVVVKCHVQSP